MDKSRPILELQGLTREFRTGGLFGNGLVRAVDSVDLCVMPGEAVGVVGESGSGKTTLARCAVRLLAPSSGRVVFDGTDLGTIDGPVLRRRRREFQIIFQDVPGSMDSRMTVKGIIAEPFAAQKVGTPAERDAWVRELAESVALEPSVLQRRPEELSGGQQQRVVIARALALRPRLLVADEPVAALDPSVQAQILNLLSSLCTGRNLTLLLISHSLAVVRHLCGRVIVMLCGRVIEDSAAECFFQAPRHPYSRALLSSSRVGLNEAREHSAAPEPVERRPAPGCAYRLQCPEARPECSGSVPRLLASGTERGSENKVACFLYTSFD